MEAPLNSLLYTRRDLTMWPLAALAGWPHERGFLVRKSMGVSPGQNKVAIIMKWPY